MSEVGFIIKETIQVNSRDLLLHYLKSTEKMALGAKFFLLPSSGPSQF
jgi:hypothetical protein